MEERRSVVFLGDDVLYLSPVEEGDIVRMQRWINDPEVWQFLAMYMPMNFRVEKKYFETMYESPNEIPLAIVLREGNQHIGSIALHKIDWKNRFATTGMLLGGKDFWGKGYGSRAKILLLHYAFAELNLQRIKSRVYSFNERSQNALKKCGYVQEGVSRREFYRDGKYHDVLEFGLLREEFEPVWQKYLEENKKGER